MLLNANLVFYKDAINTYVYCPEIDFAQSGELMKDAEFHFYSTYQEHLDSLSCYGENVLHNFLLNNKWIDTKDGLVCPDYDAKDAFAVLVHNRLGKYENQFHLLSVQQCTIVIPLYEKNKKNTGISDRFFPKQRMEIPLRE